MTVDSRALVPILAATLLAPSFVARARPALRPWILDLDDHPGLLASDVTAIDGDARGRIWFATAEGGASRYDPRTGRWRNFADAATLGGKVVMDVLVARDGAVWFGIHDGGTVRYQPDTGVWTRIWTDRGPVPDGHTLLEDSRGQIWVISFNSELFRYRPDEDHWELVGDDEWDPLRHVEDIAEDEHGAMWVLSGSHGLFAMDPQTLERRYHHARGWEGESEAPLEAMHVDGRGTVWVSGRTGGLGRFDIETGAYEHLVTHYPVDPDLWVDEILHARDGRLWTRTWGRGVRAHDPETRGWRDPSPPRGGGSYGAFLLEDSEGDVWVGSGSGNVARFDRQRQRWEASLAPLITGDTAVTTAYEDPRGDLWFGTRGAGALHWERDTGEWDLLPMRTDGTLAGDVANAVARAPDGDLWFTAGKVLAGVTRGTGAWGGGIHRYSPGDGTWRTYREAEGFRGASARDVHVTSRGHVHVGSSKAMVVLDRATDRFFVPDANNSDAMVGMHDFAEDADGHPWAVSWRYGLSTADEAASPHWRDLSPAYFFDGRTMNWLSASPEGELWAGDRQGSLAVLRPGAEDWDCCSTPQATRGLIRGLAFPVAGEARWWWGDEGQVGYQADATSPVRWQEPPDDTWIWHGRNPGIALIDDRGAAWVGYRYGLVRYDEDGARVDVFREEDGIDAWMAEDGVQDRSGAIWLTDDSHAITRLVYDDAGPHRPLVLDGEPDGRGHAALMEGRGGDGFLCWARPGGLTLAGPRRSTQVPFSPVKEWHSAVDGAPGGCWVGHFLSGVVLVEEDGSMKRFGVAEGLPDARVLDVSQVQGAGGPRAWIATDAGAALVDRDWGVLRSVTAAEGSTPGAVDHMLALPGGVALLVFEPFDPKWFVDAGDADARATLHLRRVSAAGEIGDPIPLAATEVRDLAVDGEGTLWLATDVGMFRLEEGANGAILVPLPDGYTDPQRIAADPTGVSGAVWLAFDGIGITPARLLRYDPTEDSWRPLTSDDGLPTAPRIDMLEVTPDGQLVVMAGGRLVRGRAR